MKFVANWPPKVAAQPNNPLHPTGLRASLSSARRPAGERVAVRLLADYRHNKVTMKLFEKSSLVADEGRKRARDGPKCVRSS